MTAPCVGIPTCCRYSDMPRHVPPFSILERGPKNSCGTRRPAAASPHPRQIPLIWFYHSPLAHSSLRADRAQHTVASPPRRRLVFRTQGMAHDTTRAHAGPPRRRLSNSDTQACSAALSPEVSECQRCRRCRGGVEAVSIDTGVNGVEVCQLCRAHVGGRIDSLFTRTVGRVCLSVDCVECRSVERVGACRACRVCQVCRVHITTRAPKRECRVAAGGLCGSCCRVG